MLSCLLRASSSKLQLGVMQKWLYQLDVISSLCTAAWPARPRAASWTVLPIPLGAVYCCLPALFSQNASLLQPSFATIQGHLPKMPMMQTDEALLTRYSALARASCNMAMGFGFCHGALAFGLGLSAEIAPECAMPCHAVQCSVYECGGCCIWLSRYNS